MTSYIYKTPQEKTRVLREFFQETTGVSTFVVIRDEENVADVALVETVAGARATGKTVVVSDRVLYLLTLSQTDVALALSLQASIGARAVRFKQAVGS